MIAAECAKRVERILDDKNRHPDARCPLAVFNNDGSRATLHRVGKKIVRVKPLTAQSNTERVQAAQAARELAQKQLEAEQSKFEVGMSTNYNVIQSQRDLATAQNNELQAILNYRKSLVELERLQQTTLQNLNITVIAAGGAVGGGGAAPGGQ